MAKLVTQEQIDRFIKDRQFNLASDPISGMRDDVVYSSAVRSFFNSLPDANEVIDTVITATENATRHWIGHVSDAEVMMACESGDCICKS